jgi:hypothetical protein
MKLNATIATLFFTMMMMAIPGVALAQDNASDSTQTVTGCLQKGPTANNYTMTDENGKLWDLHSKTVQLGPHIGHTVTVTGTIPQKSKGNGNDTSGDTSPQNHLRVTSLKMVSDSCQQKQ